MLAGPHRQAGDTIVEAIFAFAIFGFLVVLATSLMNQGVATAQRALEITLVRQQIDAQAEALRSIRDRYVDLFGVPVVVEGQATQDWKKIIVEKSVTTADRFGGVVGDQCPAITVPTKLFILNAHTGALPSTVEPKSSDDPLSPVFSQAVYNPTNTSELQSAYGIWIQAVRATPTQDFTDFHIRACWHAPGQASPTTLGTIVRLYAPTS